jgi:restriction system protein
MVAALLRAMNYHTPFISPKGKDGGLDIIAYNDPLGSTAPRLKVQVKHRPDASIPVDDIRSLTGLLNKDGDIGLFVTSGHFTSESTRSARESHRHIRLLDIDEFISLWQEFYLKLNDEDKNKLPLHAIYFLGSND